MRHRRRTSEPPGAAAGRHQQRGQTGGDPNAAAAWRCRGRAGRQIRRGGDGLRAQAECPDRARDVLDNLLAEIIERHRELVADLIADRPRNA